MSDDRGERERFEDWFRSVRPPRDTAVALRWRAEPLPRLRW